MLIDSHQHFWNYSAEEYGWINDSMSVLRRDFLPAHLEEETARAGVDGVVSVQARQTLAEAEWLLDLAGRHAFIRGVVGWAPLVDRHVADILESLAARPKLRGVRHVLQDEPDERYMLRDDFTAGIRNLQRFGLVYDILIYERHLPQTIEFVDGHPNQIFVLDHIAKPRIRERLLSPWRENIRELARRENVYCKISGMVTEADHRRWTERDLEPYLDSVLEAFKPGRLMFGSDWPVCLLACDYARWFWFVSQTLQRLSADEQGMIWGGTAISVYGLAREW